MSVRTLTEMLGWVENNLASPAVLPKMASRFGYSPYYCSAQLHVHLGMPFRAYLAQRRLCRAGSALLEGNLRILDIAVDFGFSSNEAFARAFRRAYGCTPREYRRAALSGRNAHDHTAQQPLPLRQREKV